MKQRPKIERKRTWWNIWLQKNRRVFQGVCSDDRKMAELIIRRHQVEKPPMCSIGLKIDLSGNLFFGSIRGWRIMIYPIKDQETMLAVPMDMNRQQDTVCSKDILQHQNSTILASNI
uniref:Uncharacterized protein n=1 Tax=Oryza meridionalis TaxID=40149 RepID=A0A0E0D2Y5_9ORYZ